jgi:hypothetical protein
LELIDYTLEETVPFGRRVHNVLGWDNFEWTHGAFFAKSLKTGEFDTFGNAFAKMLYFCPNPNLYLESLPTPI